MSTNILKVVLFLLLVGNIGYMGYQVYYYYNDIGAVQEQVEESVDRLAKIKKSQLSYKRDLGNIVRNELVTVDNVRVALSRHAAALGIRDDRDEIAIPIKPNVDKGRVYDQNLWKLTFDRKKKYKARILAQFCRNIERDLPGYQVKVFDIGQRSDSWGEDSWSPKEITVRRFNRREK